MKFEHFSVMADECVAGLDIKENGIYVDCTLGGCGHSKLILDNLRGGRLIGIDQDIAAIENSANEINDRRFSAIHGNFFQTDEILDSLKIVKIDGALFDLGVSSYQIDTAERGFSYMKDAPLDMRMDIASALDAKTVVNTYSKLQLERIFYDYGEEKFSRVITKNIIEARNIKEIETTLELAGIIASSIPAKFKNDGHPSKRVFQALRIEVNSELSILNKSIEAIAEKLNPGGRLVIITFHSLEDRIVKNALSRLSNPCECPRDYPCVCNLVPTMKLINRKVILPSSNELSKNNRSHSAKLRIAEKL